ncbi:hypothetical protein V6Z11_1Z070500 [Gossypium hirsutum]
MKGQSITKKCQKKTLRASPFSSATLCSQLRSKQRRTQALTTQSPGHKLGRGIRAGLGFDSDTEAEGCCCY